MGTPAQGPWNDYAPKNKPVQAADGPWNDYARARDNAPPQPAPPTRPGFFENLGKSLGVQAPHDQWEAHPVSTLMSLPGQLAVNAPTLPGRAVVGTYEGGKRIIGELGETADAIRQGNLPSAEVHAVQSLPFVGSAATRMMDESPVAQPGQSYLGRVMADATPGNIGTALGAAANVAPMALGGLDSIAPKRPVIANPNVNIPSMNVRAQAAKYFPSFVDPEPASLIRPISKNNISWNSDVKTALPLMKSAEMQLGHPVAGVDDALDAIGVAKKNIWSQYQQRLGPAVQMGAQIDGNAVADAMMQSVDRRTALQNPGLVDRVKAVADTYRRPMNLDEAEEFLKSTNKDLNTYYLKNKVGRQVALNDPNIASTVAEGEALRSALYGKLDTLAGPGSAQLKQAYGSLSNVEKELYGRQLAAARQNPESLAEQISTARGAGKIIKGVATMSPSDVMEGVENIVVSRALKARNSSDSMIKRAFAKAQPAQPFPAPAPFPPSGQMQLPRGAIPMGPGTQWPGAAPAYATPPMAPMTRAARLGRVLPANSSAPIIPPGINAMTPGERVAALEMYLRMMQPKGLPAKASPIQLPPPSQ